MRPRVMFAQHLEFSSIPLFWEICFTHFFGKSFSRDDERTSPAGSHYDHPMSPSLPWTKPAKLSKTSSQDLQEGDYYLILFPF